MGLTSSRREPGFWIFSKVTSAFGLPGRAVTQVPFPHQRKRWLWNCLGFLKRNIRTFFESNIWNGFIIQPLLSSDSPHQASLGWSAPKARRNVYSDDCLWTDPKKYVFFFFGSKLYFSPVPKRPLGIFYNQMTGWLTRKATSIIVPSSFRSHKI
jgi:hypothetical protein